MMHSDHYAIVIGLSCYPRLGDPPADLKGPENDAQAMKEWLIADTGGGLSPDNVKVICSKNFNAPPEAAPTPDNISEEGFLWLDKIAEKNHQEGKRRTVGARLYLYASGHGFSPRHRQACLLTGNAAERQFSANVFCSAWIDWLQDAEYFREFVLWMDCCMDRSVLTQPTPPPLDAIGGNSAPGPSFIAFAAPRPLKAVEKPIPDDEGKWHGVFTWNLLQGLRGAAANSFGIVTGRSLADWLRQAQLSWLDDADRRNPDVAKVPAIIDENDSLVFAREVTPPSFDVRLRFPETMTGKTARLWWGSPPKPGKAFRISKSGATLKLKPGLYLAEAAAGRLRQGFSVTRPCELMVSETGDSPVDAPGLFRLTVNSDNPTASIQLIGDGFRSVDSGSSMLQSRLPFGLYQMRICIGRQIVEKVILLDADWPKAGRAATDSIADMPPSLPKLTLAAPLPDTRATSELLQKTASAAQDQPDVTVGAGAELMVMARSFSESGDTNRDAPPWESVAVFDSSGNLIAELNAAGRKANDDSSPLAVCTFSLAPGFYVLRYPLEDGTQIEQSLVLPPGGWRMEAYLLYRLDATGTGRRPRISLLMRRSGAPWGTAEDTHLEEARIALTDERPVMNDALIALLLLKSENPLAGIIGGHLLVVEQEHGDRDRLNLLNSVIPTLRSLVGEDHPDVEALSLACPDPKLRTRRPIPGAPLFERSWRMIVKASYANAALVPQALWQQVHAMVAIPPYFRWSIEAETQKGFRAALARTIFKQQPVNQPGSAAASAQMAFPSFAAPGTSDATIMAGSIQNAGIVPGEPLLTAKRAEALGVPPVALEALQQEWDERDTDK